MGFLQEAFQQIRNFNSSEILICTNDKETFSPFFAVLLNGTFKKKNCLLNFLERPIKQNILDNRSPNLSILDMSKDELYPVRSILNNTWVILGLVIGWSSSMKNYLPLVDLMEMKKMMKPRPTWKHTSYKHRNWLLVGHRLPR